MIPCEFDITSTPFCDTTILTYDIYLPPTGKDIGFNLLDDEDFTIPYVTDTIKSSPAGHQLKTQDKKKMLIFSINGEEPITAIDALDELNFHKTPRGKSKVSISQFRRNCYQRKFLEDISPYLIKSDLCFHILKFFYQRNLSPQRILVKI